MILVTGATGFIGQHLVKQLVDAQYPVCCLIRPSPRERAFAPGVKNHIVAGDVDDLPALRVALYNATHVIHLAGVWEETERDTFEATKFKARRTSSTRCTRSASKRLITISSLGAHTHSAFPYMRIKAQVDDMVEASGLDYTILESSAVYGPGDNWTETIDLALRRFPFFFPIPGDGRVRLQPLHVSDLARCILACLADDKTSRKTYAVGGPQHLTYDDMISTIMQVTDHTHRKRYLRPASARALVEFHARLHRRAYAVHQHPDRSPLRRSHNEPGCDLISVRLYARAPGAGAGLFALNTVMPDFDIRPLHTLAEFHAAEELQRAAWGSADIDIAPLHIMLTIAKNGGVVLGAFAADQLIGCVFGFIGASDQSVTQLKHTSHQMGVLPEWQSRGVGYALKVAQREAVLQQGLRLMTWTYDPLESKNARLNIAKLGAVCNTYIRD